MKILRVISRHGKLILRVIGTAGLLASLYFIVVGIICLASGSTSADEEGYYPNWVININKESSAVVLPPDDALFGGSQARISQGNLKIEVTNNDPSKETFIGLAREDSIDTYLNGVEYYEATSLRIFPGSVKFTSSPGNITPGTPALQSFWTDSTQGIEKQILVWDVRSGSNYLVIMNSDGSAGLDIRLVIKGKSALLFLGGIGGIMIGGFILLLSLFMLLNTRRARNSIYPPPLTFSEPLKQTSESDTPDMKR